MDDPEYEGVVSLLRGRKGWNEKLSSISEFKEELEEADLAHERFDYGYGWVLWRENERQLRILTLLQNIASKYRFILHLLVQFWAVVKVEGMNHYLSTSNYPFIVGLSLNKGICWYRKLCRDHVYIVDINDDDDPQEQQQQQLIGGVGRAYRNKQPESSPDLRLYSTHEFPMRDEAARSGFRAYMSLPLFDSDSNQCCGVLELLSADTSIIRYRLPTLDTALEVAGLRSTHSPIQSSATSSSSSSPEMQLDNEIREILELAMLAVPRLYLTQVWVPCQQCTNSCYMHIQSFRRSKIDAADDYDYDYDYDYGDYDEACRLHSLQIDVSTSFDSNLCDMSISKSPLAHYAQIARINTSHSFAISLQSLHNTNHLYFIQFSLLQSKFREDDDACGLLCKMMNMNLKCFKFVPGGSVSESQNSNAIECELTDRLDVIKSYKEEWSQCDFMTYLGRDASGCLQPSPAWFFGVNSNSLLMPVMINDKIENFMKNIHLYREGEHWIIQFWAPKIVEDRCYLQALDQPYIVGCLSKGLALFREICTTHSYFVDDQAKQEELGPPGRVFRNEYPEISPDLFNYTTKEYSIRNYAMHREYLALPIFDDELNHKCVGVLEFLGFHYSELKEIERTLKTAKLRTHTDFLSRSLADDMTPGRKEALTEVRNSLELIRKIPLFCRANVWVLNGECIASINSNTSCMELTLSTNHYFSPAYQVKRIHVQTRKGMIGMVLASENKSCFCQNLGEFSIADQPLSHFEMSNRLDVCFAICLQSSHTGALVYVVEFFLYQGPAKYEYLRSFLNFLLPIMKHELKSFKMASGKELGEALVVEVIEFSDGNELDSSEPEEADVFPIKLRSVQYRKKEHQYSEERQIEESGVVVEHQHSEEQQTEECSRAVEHQYSEEQQTEECIVAVEHQHSEEQQTEECSRAVEHRYSEEQQTEECTVVLENQHSEEQRTEECSSAVEHQYSEEQQTEECSVVASRSKTSERGKRKNGLNLSREVLMSHFGKKLQDVAEELGIGKSTIKRACRGYGINRWPSKQKYKRNQSLLEREYGLQDMSSSSNPQSLDSSLHQNVPLTNTEEKVIIKVRCEEDIIKFKFYLSLGLAKLMEEVCTRLSLENGAFKLKYSDEDGDEILLTNDADLQLCWENQITMNKTYIQMFVR